MKAPLNANLLANRFCARFIVTFRELVPIYLISNKAESISVEVLASDQRRSSFEIGTQELESNVPEAANKRLDDVTELHEQQTWLTLFGKAAERKP
jgi:hypothetical protein